MRPGLWARFNEAIGKLKEAGLCQSYPNKSTLYALLFQILCSNKPAHVHFMLVYGCFYQKPLAFRFFYMFYFCLPCHNCDCSSWNLLWYVSQKWRLKNITQRHKRSFFWPIDPACGPPLPPKRVIGSNSRRSGPQRSEQVTLNAPPGGKETCSEMGFIGGSSSRPESQVGQLVARNAKSETNTMLDDSQWGYQPAITDMKIRHQQLSNHLNIISLHICWNQLKSVWY